MPKVTIRPPQQPAEPLSSSAPILPGAVTEVSLADIGARLDAALARAGK
jgi:hypothetical protein